MNRTAICLWRHVAAALILTLSQAILFGQADQGAMTGTVTDAQGAVVPGAQVKITNLETSFQLQTLTDIRGVYTFQPIRIGHYNLEVSAKGFATTTQQGLEVQVNQRLGVDVSLRIGAQTEMVEVSATAIPLLQTEDASTGKVLSTEQINDTPLNGRNYVFIAQLTAGVAPNSRSGTGGGTGSFYANGQRSVQSNFILDGVDNNSNSVDMLNNAVYVIKPPPDALQEFKIQTGSYSAEFGHAAGAVVNASIKSGTNRFTGNLWEYLRNDGLNSRDWYSSIGKPEYRQNQFGGTFGGPILRNKLFFFVDTEHNIIRSGSTVYATVPTAKMRSGDFSELLSPALTGQTNPIKLYEPGSAGTIPLTCNGQMNVLCASQISPLALRLFNLMPQPNYNGNLVYNNYLTNPVVQDPTHQFDVRTDYLISTKDQIFARYSWTFEDILTPGTFAGALGGLAERYIYSENGAVSYTHTFSPSWTNELRVGITWGHYFTHQGNSSVDLNSQFGLTGYPAVNAGGLGNDNGGLPFINFTGNVAPTTIGSSQFTPSEEHQNIHQLTDNMTKILGNHTLKAGALLQQIRFTVLQPNTGRGSLTYSGKFSGQPGVSFTGSGAVDFLTDEMDTAALSGLNNSNMERWYTGAYVQDDWKVTPRLTVNLGVRYDYYTAPYNRSDAQANWIPLSLAPGAGTGIYLLPESQKNRLDPAFISLLTKDNISLQFTSNRSLINAPKNLFAPRVGIAYRINNKLVMRTGFGIFYGGTENLGGYPVLSTNYPYDLEESIVSPTCSVVNGTPSCPTNGLSLATGFTKASLATPAFRGFDLNWRMGYAEQYNMLFEYAISGAMSIETGYVGSVARHLPVVVGPNDGAALVAPGVNINPYRPFPDFGTSSYIADSAISSYNSWQTTVRRRFSNGLNFLGTYTWAHSLDDAREPFPQTGEGGYRSYNILGDRVEYSSSPFDVRQRFTLNAIYELPFGKGRHFVNKGGLINQVIGGWATSWVWTAQSGNPFTVRANTVTANGASGGCCNSGAFPTLIGNPYIGGGTPNSTNPNQVCPATVGNAQHWYNPCAFADPPLGSLIQPGQVLTGNAAAAFMPSARSQLVGPGFDRVNASFFKNFPIREREYVQFRADVFNVANHPSLGLPATTLGNTAGLVTTPRFFGNYTPDARFFQLALKLYF